MAAKPVAPNKQRHLAVLIDADNAPVAIVEGLFEEIAKYGVASVKRIYGDWTKPNLGSWKKVLLDHSIQPIQQFAYTSGKNATDSALIIDAMDLLYTRRFDGFCLVSSDSDFTRLAARIREEGLTVYGFGEQKTPSPFVSACDKFIYTEILRSDAKAAAADDKPLAAVPEPAAMPKPGAADKPAPIECQQVPVEFIAKVLDDISEEDDWVQLGTLGQNISKLRPAFDPRLYGCNKLSELIRAQPGHFELEARGSGSAGGKDLYVKVRKPRRSAKR
ncbi:NYN domain-containing protein [Pseudomonas oligotrophica]|uniref:NYN domain-containing protein n=1 Tax=Pseudomonas oligotrophica TaxID=2912055 RepID=UPI001F17B245|nr:NYN domain-containing protein [Pseudomonas oligotrophica]MCF7203948.1 NYN domain-containing protein [Pseudomonas oligotrophica]